MIPKNATTFLDQRRAVDRGRLFSLSKKLFASTVQPIALRLVAFFFLDQTTSMKKPSPQMKIIKARHRSQLTDKH